MNSSNGNLVNLHSAALSQTRLGKMCGSRQLFRDRYEILRIIGRGGFGITYLARNAALPGQPLCVIKQLCPKVDHPVALQRAQQRFEQEAKALSKLGSHAQIPQLLDYFQVNGEFYLVQEYVRGMPLSKEIRRTGPWSEMAVKRFLREILPVIQYIHQHQVIHRDIKPPNIIRCKDDGRLVLIDFGAMKEKISNIENSAIKSASTQFVGTVGFAPPEQLAMRPLFGSDIYALGITCLYLLTGRPPLDFDYEFTTGEVEWRDQVLVSDHFAKVLGKMLKISPKERYQTADEVIRVLDLESHLDNLSDCMLVQARPDLGNPETLPDGYVAPMARTAFAIRDWRNRLQARQVRYHARKDLSFTRNDRSE
jgi:serine/threonine protein kinase